MIDLSAKLMMNAAGKAMNMFAKPMMKSAGPRTATAPRPLKRLTATREIAERAHQEDCCQEEEDSGECRESACSPVFIYRAAADPSDDAGYCSSVRRCDDRARCGIPSDQANSRLAGLVQHREPVHGDDRCSSGQDGDRDPPVPAL